MSEQRHTLILSSQHVVDISYLIYAEWSTAFTNYRKIGEAKWEDNKSGCPKSDWTLFHAAQMKHAKEQLDKYTALRNAVCPLASQILLKANSFGNI